MKINLSNNHYQWPNDDDNNNYNDNDAQWKVFNSFTVKMRSYYKFTVWYLIGVVQCDDEYDEYVYEYCTSKIVWRTRVLVYK